MSLNESSIQFLYLCVFCSDVHKATKLRLKLQWSKAKLRPKHPMPKMRLRHFNLCLRKVALSIQWLEQIKAYITIKTYQEITSGGSPLLHSEQFLPPKWCLLFEYIRLSCWPIELRHCTFDYGEIELRNRMPPGGLKTKLSTPTANACYTVPLKLRP